MRTVAALIYPNFELLDLYGPLEMFGWLSSQFRLVLVGAEKGPVASNMGISSIADAEFRDKFEIDVLLVPGGWGRTIPVDTDALLPWLTSASDRAERVLTVCTGSALLALTGHLDGREATTNKALFGWVAEKRSAVRWRPQARWVRDGKFYSSSGVSAGMDMTLAVIAEIIGPDIADAVAVGCEYVWNRDPDWDPFAERYGLTAPGNLN